MVGGGGGGVHVGHSLHSVLIPHQQEATCAGSFAPTRRSGMMSARNPHAHTHPPLPPATRNGGSTPATDLRLRGQLRQDLRKHAVVLRTCPLLLLPPGPAVVELLKRGQVLGGEEGGGRAENSEELWCRRHQGAGRTRGRGRAVSQRTFTHTHTHTSGTHRPVPVCARVCPQPHLPPPPHTHPTPTSPTSLSNSAYSA